MENNFPNYDMKRIESCVNELIMHFDSVQIFCTRTDADGINTQNMHLGKGNWFARYGQVKDYINICENTHKGVIDE